MITIHRLLSYLLNLYRVHIFVSNVAAIIFQSLKTVSKELCTKNPKSVKAQVISLLPGMAHKFGQ
jgi:hypothetical protein